MVNEYKWFKGNPEQFSFVEEIISGDRVVLVTPRPEKAVGAVWDDNDKIYRSSVWRVSDGAPVSLGYKKFVNFGELPGFEPIAADDPAVFVEKIDGTCLICAKYKGTHIFRTRGTLDAFRMPNGHELSILLDKNRKERRAIDSLDENHSIIFEWVSPENRLCVTYPEFKLYLTGIINHDDYSYFNQDELDKFANQYGLNRPERSEFHNCVDLPEVATRIFQEWEMREGVVAYIGKDQQVLKKMKSEWQLKMHATRILIGNTKKLVEWCYDNGVFEVDTFEVASDVIVSKLEYEAMSYYAKDIKRIWDAYNDVHHLMGLAKRAVDNVSDPHEIADMIVNGKWEHPSTYLWSEYRKTPYRKKFICDEILKHIDKK